MNDRPEALTGALIAENDAAQRALRRRLNSLVKRFASANLQAMLDFDHLGNDGLDRHNGNVLAEKGQLHAARSGQAVKTAMPIEKTIRKRMASKKSKVADPVREVIRQVKTACVALTNLIEVMSRNPVDEGEALSLTLSRKRGSGLMIEFSTSSPGRGQTIQLLLMDNEAFIEIPGSSKLVRKIKDLARRNKRSAASTANADQVFASAAPVKASKKPTASK